jgi:hypothetical protein
MRFLVLLCAGLLVAFSAAPTAAARKPVLRNACKLVTNAEIERLMGHRPIARRGYPEGCVWITKRPTGDTETGEAGEEASVALTGFASVREAKQYVDLSTESVGCEWDPLLPDPKLGDDAWLEDCGANVLFRVRRIVGKVSTFTNDAREGSRADVRRSTGLVRKAVPRLRRYRCGPPLCP